MKFYHKALIDGSECYQVGGFYEPMTEAEAAGKNRRAIKYRYVQANPSPATVTRCDGTTEIFVGGIDHYLQAYRKRIRQGVPRGMQLLNQKKAFGRAA